MQPENIVLLNIDSLIPNANQPRKKFNEESIKELAMSIKEYGILNPILVRKKDNLYEIIAGERRYRAAKSIGLNEVPVIIKTIDENKISEIALIENLQRENLTPIEEAKTYEKILKNNNNITEQNLSKLICKSQPFISNKLRLLKLPEEVQESLNNKKISEKHARSLLTIDDSKEQIALLNKTINEKLSVKELDNLIKIKKEEKESGNMNNGNFFPNYNINNQNNNNMSLNQMNMQTMGTTTTTQNVENIPQINEPIIQVQSFSDQNLNESALNTMNSTLPQVEIQNIESTSQVETPMMPELNNNNINSPISDFGANNNVITETSNILPETPNASIPLFNENVSVDTPTEVMPSVNEPLVIPKPIINEPSSTLIEETPLFNQELNSSTEQPNLNESFYEVPVNVSPVIESPKEDKFTKVSQLLSSNNIEYKAYSNETGHCIIIEL